MKKFLICLIVLVLFGCTTNTETQGKIKQKQVEDKHITKYYDDSNYSGNIVFGIEIEGHHYIVYDGYYAGNIIHAAHCPCHDKTK